MASGSSKGFDFASDDILCSYEDYANRDNSNATDSAIDTNLAKEFNKSRMARTPVFPSSTYGPTNDSDNQEVILLAVERSMKKHTDNVMRFLEGLSSRLSQLELYCYNLDKSIGEMRSDLTQDHGESDAKLKFLEKHMQEVHRSVQILRDKQELADTQKELAKLQLAQKGSSNSSGRNSQQNNEDRSSTPEPQKNETPVDPHGRQLALVPAPQPPQPAPEPVAQAPAYYMPPGHTHTQVNQTQYPQSQLPPPQVQSLPQYQQQWTPQVQPQPQPSIQPGSRPSSPQVYPQYLQAKPQPSNPSPPEPLPGSMPMQMAYSAVPPPGSNHNQPPMAYSYGGPVHTTQPQQPLKMGFSGQPGDGYATGGPPTMYMVYDNAASGRVQQPGQGGQFYPPPNQQQSGSGGGGGVGSGGGVGGGMMSRPPPQHQQQFVRNHPYNEVIDKLVSMGYRGDHVMSVIQRLDESGQTVDFNTVLDRLNGGGWSG